MNIETKYGDIKVYAKTLEQAALSQIIKMANSPLGNNANLRIMPDAHAGAGCVIGTTMKITDKVCPNLVGVDIGCGVDLVKTTLDFSDRFEQLDKAIRERVPSGMTVHTDVRDYDFSQLRCWGNLKKEVRETAMHSLGTLGGGNHFIEAYEDGYISVHSGSRNIGYKVAEYYQDLAKTSCKRRAYEGMLVDLQSIPTAERQNWIKAHTIKIDEELSYLEGSEMDNYLHDIDILQRFAVANRRAMSEAIVDELGGLIVDAISSTHNYIDTDSMILRKGAISAKAEELLVIPMNMRDGLLVCEGKGNPDWNYSAPHGAGRLYSRSAAKKAFTVQQYEKSMEGIYTTCINESTLDEAPFVYKDFKEIIECIEPTVQILKRLTPIYNFKAC